jgi:hypothetical protein
MIAGHSAAGRPARPPAAAAPSAAAPPAAVVDTGLDPGSLTGWADVVAALYRRRAAAFTAPTPDGGSRALTSVYAPGSRQRAADEAQVRALTRAGEMLRGFDPTVVQVTRASTAGGRTELRLVDRWARYDVVPAGQASAMPLRTGPARQATDVRMVLLRTAAGWRIAEVERLA